MWSPFDVPRGGYGPMSDNPFLTTRRDRFKLGAFEVTNLLDGYVQGSPHPTFGNNQTPETVQAYAKAQGLPATKMENVYVNTLVNTGKELVLFDTGNGRARM